MPHVPRKPSLRTRVLVIVVLPALVGLIAATAVSKRGAILAAWMDRMETAAPVAKMEVTVIGDRVEVRNGPVMTDEELHRLGDAIKASYPSTAIYPAADGTRLPIWKYACEIEWGNGEKRLKSASPLHGL